VPTTRSPALDLRPKLRQWFWRSVAMIGGRGRLGRPGCDLADRATRKAVTGCHGDKCVGDRMDAGRSALAIVGLQDSATRPFDVALLAAVHGIALAVRAGASGRVYCWAVTAVVAIGVGAFAVSFLALRDLMRAIGYSYATAWIFPAIIDAAVAVSNLMLVALGDKPVRRARAVGAQIAPAQRPAQGANKGVNATARRQAVQPSIAQTPVPSAPARAQTSAPSVPSRVASAQGSAHITAHAGDADLASIAVDLLESGVTTQPVDTVIAALAATLDGASINAAAKASGINYRTAQRIVEGAAERRHRQLVAVG
jgi:hypothetical protein